MTINSLSPGFLKIFYDSNAHDHQMTLPVKPNGTPTPGVDMILDTIGGGTTPASTFAVALAEVLDPFFTSAASFNRYEAWSQPTPADDPIFIFGGEIGEVGTGTGTPVTASEYVFTWRCTNGTLLKMYLLETIVNQNQRFSLPSLTTGPEHDLDVFIRSSASAVFSRGGGKPIVGINATSKMNDTLRRKYILS